VDIADQDRRPEGVDRVACFANTALLNDHLCRLSGCRADKSGDPVRGKAPFNRCSGCHSVQGKNMAGPPLNGVSGRKAAAIEGYRYSGALANSGINWTDEALDS